MHYNIKSLQNYNLLCINLSRQLSSFIINNINIYIYDSENIIKNKFLLKSLFDYGDLSYLDVNLMMLSTKKIYNTRFGEIYRHILPHDTSEKIDIIETINNIEKKNQILVLMSEDIDCKNIINKITNKETKIHFMNINFEDKFIEYFVINNDIEFLIYSNMEEIIDYFYINLSKPYIKISGHTSNEKKMMIKSPVCHILKKDTYIGVLLDKEESKKLLINDIKIKLFINNKYYYLNKKHTELDRNKKIIYSLLGIMNKCNEIKHASMSDLYNLIDLYIITNNLSYLTKYDKLKKIKKDIDLLFDDSYYKINILTELYRNRNINNFINNNKNIIEKIIKYEQMIEYRDALYINKIKSQSLNLQKQVINNIDNSTFLKLTNDIDNYINNYNIPNKSIIDKESFYYSIINHSTYHEEIKNGDILGLLINLSYNNSSTCFSLDDIEIKNISLSFIFFSDLIDAQIYYYNKLYYFDNGKDDNNHAISGNGIGDGNSIIPLYINKSHFNLVKILYKYILGLSINQDLFSYHKNYYLLPLLVLSKFNILLFTEFKLNDKAINIWKELIKTCKELYNEYIYNYKYYLVPYTNFNKLLLDDKLFDISIKKYSSHVLFLMYIILFNKKFDIIKLHLKTLKLFKNKFSDEDIFLYIKIYDILYNRINDDKEYFMKAYDDIDKYGKTVDEFLKNKYNYITYN